MDRLTIKHVGGVDDTQTDILPHHFLGTRLVNLSGSDIYHVYLLVTDNITLKVGEHLDESEARSQVDAIWESFDDLPGNWDGILEEMCKMAESNTKQQQGANDDMP